MSSTQQLLLGEGAGGAAPTYIEEVFSTYLYTGNSGAQTITNGIDLSGKGGLVWIKDRTNGGANYENALTDTVRGATYEIQSDTTAAQTTNAARLTSFNSNGFSIGTSIRYNQSGDNYVSWTFRKQPKFFDVVTYTGNGSNRTIAHNLGSAPGFIIIKSTTVNDDWYCYHHSLTASGGMNLNTTNGYNAAGNLWNSTYPTSTVFSLGTNTGVNQSGQTYVAYLFAHNAGGFGASGTDNVISCGSYTEGSSDVTVSLGYEPAWILVKPSSTTGNWNIYDTMRGAALTGNTAVLRPNTSDAEAYPANYWYPTSTGFVAKSGNYGSGQPIVYIAIRRGPMAVPTSGTSVFSTSVSTSNSGLISSGFATDFVMALDKTSGTTPYNRGFSDRLRGNFKTIGSSVTDVEDSNATTITFDSSNGIILNGGGVYSAGYVYEQFRRAPSFFDEVCYTGTGANRTVTHNLSVAPELMIIKSRSLAANWRCYSSATGATKFFNLNSTQAASTDSSMWNDTAPTSSVFTLGTDASLNNSGSTFVAYLFATCSGVSKVGSYTGTATTLQVNCGFTGGARFVLIKRTDSTGDWYLWDSARGIVAGNDPYLLMNTNAAQVTNTDYVDTYSAGFEISSTAPAAINASGGSFIFLAIA